MENSYYHYGAPDAEIALTEDNTLFKATANQNPHFMSYKAVEVAIDYLADKKVDKTTLTPTRIITKDNLDDYKGWGNKNK